MPFLSRRAAEAVAVRPSGLLPAAGRGRPVPALLARLLGAVAALTVASAAQAQAPDVITPGDNLLVDGLPPIPRRIAAEVRRYTETRSAAVADWHPVRRELLISTRFANTNQLHRVAMPLGARQQLTFFEEPVGGGSWEPVAGRYLLFTRDNGGDEFGQLYRLDPATGTVTLLSDGGRSQNGGAVWSRTGTRIAYMSTRRNGADRDLWLMDPADRATDRMVTALPGGGWSVLDWSADERTLLVQEYRSVTRSDLWLVDVATGQRTRLTPGDAVYTDAQFDAAGTGVWLISDAAGEFRQLAHLTLATRAITMVPVVADAELEGLVLSPDRRTLAVTANLEGASGLFLVDAVRRRATRVERVPTGLIGGVRWRPDGRELALTFSSAASPGDAWTLDVRTGVLTRWTESELGGLPAADLRAPTLVTWPSFDGRRISGFLYAPPARFTGKRPVIINIHGGPEGQSRPGFIGRNNFFTQELGAYILYPNVRGSVGFGKTFVALDDGMKRLDSVRDIGALLDWIATQPTLDASRVMVTGGSYGGYMTLMVATMYDDRIAASLDVVGISNLRTFLTNTEAYRRDLRRVEYGDERDPAMRAFMDSTAALTNAARITKPLFVVQGANDPRVPKSEADQMVATVKRNGSPVWYLVAADEGHGFRKKGNVDFQFYATVSFIRQFLLGERPAS